MNIVKKKSSLYQKNGEVVRDQNTLNRIKQLNIPPNWKNVKIADSDTNYLQAIGKDDKNRTQYIYHPVWNELTKAQKYSRMTTFSEKLPIFTSKIDKILNGKIDFANKEYLIALVFKILFLTHSRIGNDMYATENKTYGLTTLLKKHVKIKGDIVQLSFVGKKNVQQNLNFKNNKVLKIIRELLQLPGERLFKTLDGEPIKSLEMNDYLKENLGSNFTCKDFRTYASNILILEYLSEIKIMPASKTESKKILNEIISKVADTLGHTKCVSKKSYIIPEIHDLFMNNPKYFVGQDPGKIFKKIISQTYSLR
jgi:DNA topoisomerase-1